jgi:hypothetical protein
VCVTRSEKAMTAVRHGIATQYIERRIVPVRDAGHLCT